MSGKEAEFDTYRELLHKQFQHVYDESIHSVCADPVVVKPIATLVNEFLNKLKGLKYSSTTPSTDNPITSANRSSSLSFSSPSPDPNQRHPIRGYIDGCYDLTHAGHFNAIRQAKTLCDVLIVGIHTDIEIAHHKGPVVMRGEERVASVRACKWVDEVVFGTPYDPSVELLDELKCDFCIHGDDESTTATGEDAFAAVKKAGRMKIVKRTEGVSTTNLVGRILLAGRIERQRHADERAHEDRISESNMLDESTISTKTVSSFLATTFRINQFSSCTKPKKTDRVVYICGDFDLYHAGHVELLCKARELGDFLYVGIWTDEECTRLYGSAYPIMSLFERAFCVLGCKYVNEVVLGAPYGVTEDLIRTLNVHTVVDGSYVHPIPIQFAEINYKELKLQQPNLNATDKESAVFDEEVRSETHKNFSDLFSDYAYKVARDSNIITKLIPDPHSSTSLEHLKTKDIVNRVCEYSQKYENRNAKRVVKEQTYFEKKIFVEEI